MARGRIAFAAAFVVMLALIGAAAAAADQTYTDAVGDGGIAPDITQVVVQIDAGGVITFRVLTAQPITANSKVAVGIDTDFNRATGGLGADYAVNVTLTSGALMKASPLGGYEAVSSPSLSTNVTGNVVEIRLDGKEIGLPTKFGFWTATVQTNNAGSAIGGDGAPNTGEYIYGAPVATHVTLKAAKPTEVPVRPKAGKVVVVSAAVTQAGNGKAVGSGTVHCIAHAGTKTLRPPGHFVHGRASCGFAIPSAAKGKTVTGKLTVDALGASTAVPFAFKVS